MATKLYPPTISGVLPAFYRTYNTSGDLTGATITVPYSMNRAISYKDISGFVLKIKTVNTDTVVMAVTTRAYSSDTNTAIFTLTAKEATQLNLGQFYKIQLAYMGTDGEAGYFSSIGTIKCIEKPNVYILNQTEHAINLLALDYTGVYQQTAEADFTEKVYSYCFNLYDNNNNLIYTTGEQLHNTSNDSAEDMSIDNCTIKENVLDDTIYQIEYIVTTVNNLTLKSPLYKLISAPAINFEKDIAVSAYSDIDEGYVIVSFLGAEQEIYDFNATIASDIIPRKKVEVLCNGSFVLSRSSSKDNFGSWLELDRFKLSGEKPSTRPFYDYTVEQGVSYKYSLQQYNTKGVYSKRNTSNTVFADFEDAYLFDGKQSLRIRFNPKLSSFKTTLLETKVDTIGSQYPYIFRNGNVGYKEFPISGLISYQMDINHRFTDWTDLSVTNINRRKNTRLQRELPDEVLEDAKDYAHSDLIAENITMERNFKLNVLDWLNNGEVKLFRSPTEGNYLVRLMNVSLTPNDTLGRMLHTFNCTAYEIAECSYTNLVQYGIVSLNEAPSLSSVMWQSYLQGDSLSLPEGAYYSLSCENFAPGDIVEIHFANATYDTSIAIGADGQYFISFDDPLITSAELISTAPNSEGYARSFVVSMMGNEVHKFDIISNVQLVTIPFQQFMSSQSFTSDPISGQPIGTNLIDEINVHIGSEEKGTNKVELLKFEQLTLRERELVPIFKYNEKYVLPYSGFSADSLLDLCDSVWREEITSVEETFLNNYLEKYGLSQMFDFIYQDNSLNCFDSTNIFIILDFEVWKKYFDISSDATVNYGYYSLKDAIKAVGEDCVIGYLDPIALRRTNRNKTYFHYDGCLQYGSSSEVLTSNYGTFAYVTTDKEYNFRNTSLLEASNIQQAIRTYPADKDNYNFSYLYSIALWIRNGCLTTGKDSIKNYFMGDIYATADEAFKKAGAISYTGTSINEMDLRQASRIFREASTALFPDAVAELALLKKESKLGVVDWGNQVWNIATMWTGTTVNGERVKGVYDYISSNYNFLNLEASNEITFKDLDNLSGIYFENGVLAEGTYQIRVVDYAIEETNTEVKKAKDLYLAYRESLDDLMEIYAKAKEAYNSAKIKLSSGQDANASAIISPHETLYLINKLIANITYNKETYSFTLKFKQLNESSGQVVDVSKTITLIGGLDNEEASKAVFDKKYGNITTFKDVLEYLADYDQNIISSDSVTINLDVSENGNSSIFGALTQMHIIDSQTTQLVWTMDKAKQVYEVAESLLGQYYLKQNSDLYDENGTPLINIWDPRVENYTTWDQSWIADRDYDEAYGVYQSYLDVVEQIKEEIVDVYCRRGGLDPEKDINNYSIVNLEDLIFDELKKLFEEISDSGDYKDLKKLVNENAESFAKTSSKKPYLWYLTAYLENKDFNLDTIKEPKSWNFLASKRLDPDATETTDGAKTQQELYYSLVSGLKSKFGDLDSEQRTLSNKYTALERLQTYCLKEADNRELFFLDDITESDKFISQLEKKEIYLTDKEKELLETDNATKKKALFKYLKSKNNAALEKYSADTDNIGTINDAITDWKKTLNSESLSLEKQIEREQGAVKEVCSQQEDLLTYVKSINSMAQENTLNDLNAKITAREQILVDLNAFLLKDTDPNVQGKLLDSHNLQGYFAEAYIYFGNNEGFYLDIGEKKDGLTDRQDDLNYELLFKSTPSVRKVTTTSDQQCIALDFRLSSGKSVTTDMIQAIQFYIMSYLWATYRDSDIFYPMQRTETIQVEEDGEQKEKKIIYNTNVLFNGEQPWIGFMNWSSIESFYEIMPGLYTYLKTLRETAESEINKYTQSIINLQKEEDVLTALINDTETECESITNDDEKKSTLEKLLADLNLIKQRLEERLVHYRSRLKTADQMYAFYQLAEDKDWMPSIIATEEAESPSLSYLAQAMKRLKERYKILQDNLDAQQYILSVLISSGICDQTDNGEIKLPDIEDTKKIATEDDRWWIFVPSLEARDFKKDDIKNSELIKYEFGYTYNSEAFEQKANGGLYLWVKHQLEILKKESAELQKLTNNETGCMAIITRHETRIEAQLKKILTNRNLFQYLLDILDEQENKVEQAKQAQASLQQEIKQLKKDLSINPETTYWEAPADIKNTSLPTISPIIIKEDNSVMGTGVTYRLAEKKVEELWDSFIAILSQAYIAEIESRYNL